MESESNRKIVVAVDIGGTLSKVGVWCDDVSVQEIFVNIKQRVSRLQIRSSQCINEKLVFWLITFQGFQELFTFLTSILLEKSTELKILATGGGALKYKEKFSELKQGNKDKIIEYKVELNEFQTILPAIQLLTETNHMLQLTQESTVINQLLVSGNYHSTEQTQIQKIQKHKNKLQPPFLLANIGSGMSVLKLQKLQDKLCFTRVGGSALGGGFLMGMERILNPKFTFESLSTNQMTSEELQIMQHCIKNLSQLIRLYLDIHQVQNVLITGGMVKSRLIKDEFIKNLGQDNVFFTELDGYLSVVGMLYQECQQVEQLGNKKENDQEKEK